MNLKISLNLRSCQLASIATGTTAWSLVFHYAFIFFMKFYIPVDPKYVMPIELL